MKYGIQRFTQSVTLPQNYDTGYGANVNDLNGILRGVTIVAPNLSGTSYTLSILGNRGETLYSKSSLTENATTAIIKDADNLPLAIPIAVNGTPVIKIKSAGTDDATGTLTWTNTTAIANNDTVTIGDVTYTFKTTLTGAANEILIEPAVAATAVLTSDNTNVSAGETVTIGEQTYTFDDNLAAADVVKIGADADTTLANLKAAINGSGTPGNEYSTGTSTNASVTCGNVTSHTITVTAKVAGASGNLIAKAASATHLDWDGTGAYLTGGDTKGDETLTNLKKAINHEATEGTNYGTGTVANPYVTAAAVSSHAIVVTAVEAVIGNAEVATTETSSVLSWAGATLSGGGESAEQTFSVDLLIER